MTASSPVSDRPAVDLLNAAIRHHQDAITAIMRAKAKVLELYDEADIQAAVDADSCNCGPACICDLRELMIGSHTYGVD